MRQILKTGSAATKKRFEEADKDAEALTIGADDDIVQITLKQDVSAAAELLRTVSQGISAFSPNDFQGTQSSPKGYPITKGEAQILAGELDDSKTVAIKLFISSNRKFVNELYRRFVSSTTGSDTYENFQRFKKYLEMKEVPPEAWKFNNVEVYPRFNQFAGKASTNYATARGLVEATQIKPASKAEEKAKRDLIAALTGEANVLDYLDIAPQLEQEVMIIGQENEALDSPYANPANIPVTPTDNHQMHLQGHLQDYIFKLQLVSQLLKTAGAEQSHRKLFLIERAADIVNSQDNKGAHIVAHIESLQKDETKADELRAFTQQFAQAQAEQDKLAAIIGKAQQDLSTNANLMSSQEADLVHKQRMNDLEYTHAKAMNNVGLEKAGMQTAARQEATQQNQAIKVSGKTQDQELKRQAQQQDIEAKRQAASIDINKKQVELAMKQTQKATNDSQKAKKEPVEA
jgi:hypothetical protein